MPRKTFVNGQILTETDLNDFLMNQSVMVFDDAAARSSAIGTATEGMVTYLKNDDNLYTYSGSAWVKLDSLPSQTGNANGLLTTNGSAASWLAAGSANTFLQSKGTALQWAAFEVKSGYLFTTTTFGTVVGTAIAAGEYIYDYTSNAGIPAKIGSVSLTTITTSGVFVNRNFITLSSSPTISFDANFLRNMNQRTIPFSANNVAYGNSRYVVTQGTSFAYSTDTITWTSGTFPGSANTSFTMFGSGVFVSVPSGAGTGVRSTDGITWTTFTRPLGSNSLRAFNYGNGRFLGSSNSGGYMHSTDGVTWTTGTDSNHDFYSISYANGFYWLGGITATAPNPTILRRSTDLVTWTTITPGNVNNAGQPIYSFDYVSNYYVLGQNDRIVYSTDLITWTSNNNLFCNQRSLVFGSAVYLPTSQYVFVWHPPTRIDQPVFTLNFGGSLAQDGSLVMLANSTTTFRIESYTPRKLMITPLPDATVV